MRENTNIVFNGEKYLFSRNEVIAKRTVASGRDGENMVGAALTIAQVVAGQQKRHRRGCSHDGGVSAGY